MCFKMEKGRTDRWTPVRLLYSIEKLIIQASR